MAEPNGFSPSAPPAGEDVAEACPGQALGLCGCSQCHADQLAEQEEASAEKASLPPELAALVGKVVARYGVMRALGGFSHNLERRLLPGAKVVARTERGVELAEVVAIVSEQGGPGLVTPAKLMDFIRSCGPDYPFMRDGKFLRLANSQDLLDQRHLDGNAHEEATYCRKEIRAMKLSMKLVTVEHLLGGERIIFYFSSETRVDFRDLVRRLAAQYRTRIEMRQVGARDEARLVGDFERCGRPCCCQGFLKDLKPISMRMAKTQKATLDPAKISGRCGRLMCCLRYEDAGYEELRARLPRKNTFVRTATAVGKVIDGQILTQLVRLLLQDGTQVVIGNDEIVQRDVPPVSIQPPAAPRPAEPPKVHVRLADLPEAAPKTQTPPTADGDVAAENDDQPALPSEGQPAVPSEVQRASTPASPGQEDSQRRRHRRGRRRRGGERRDGQGGNAAPSQPARTAAPNPTSPQSSPLGATGQAGGPPAGQGPSDGQGQGGQGGGRRRRRRRRH
jgi:cell fate regulator YaaT (PSP1 superfamily)